MDKIYQTNDELIQYLNEHHNINLSDAKEYLEEFRFGSFYSPYKDLFATDLSRGKRIFSEGLSTQDFVDIINLDLYLCIRLNNALGNFERRLKNYLITIVCDSMKKEGDEKSCCYSFIQELLDGNLSSLCFVGLSVDYDVRGKNSILKSDGKLYNQRKSFLEKLKKILEDVDNSKLDYYTKQYYLKYNSLPFYILVGNLAFGDLCILFGMLKIEHREKFVAAFKGKEVHTSDIFSFCTILSYLTLVRNKVHHHEPIIPVFSDVSHNETISSRIMAIKNLLRFYNESKYFHLDISNIKPSLKIKIKGRNTEYCKNLERFYSLF